MIKAVIFDMDGVIIDSQMNHYHVFSEYCNELGVRVDFDYYSNLIGMSDADIFGIIKNDFNVKHHIKHLIDEYQDRYIDFLQMTHIEPIGGVSNVIIELYNRGISLALASSSTLRSINAVLGSFNLNQYFRVIVSGEQIDNAKPAPDIFLNTSDLLGVKNESCIVIEDSCNGVMAAKRAGMYCIAYFNPNSGSQDLSKADKIIDRFDDDLISMILDML